MSKPRTPHPSRTPRREFLRQGSALGVAAALPTFAWAQGDELAPYRSAKVNWRQAEGQEITVAVIPASYFDNLITLQPQFEALTGIKLRFEKVPPGPDPAEGVARPVVQDRHVRDACGGSDVLPAVRVEQVGRSARPVPGRPAAHGRRVVQLRRHHQGVARRRLDRRQALRHTVRRRGDGAGLSQGPVRREGAEARRHVRAAQRQRESAERSCQPRVRARLARLRGRGTEHVHLSVALPRIRGQLGQRQQRRRQFAGSGERADVVRRHARGLCAPRRAQLELARHRRRIFARTGRDLHRRALLRCRHHQSGEVQGRRQDRLRPLAQGPQRQARDVHLELGLSRSTRRCPSARSAPPGSSSPGRRRRRRRPARRSSSRGRASARA